MARAALHLISSLDALMTSRFGCKHPWPPFHLQLLRIGHVSRSQKLCATIVFPERRSLVRRSCKHVCAVAHTHTHTHARVHHRLLQGIPRTHTALTARVCDPPSRFPVSVPQVSRPA